MTDTNAHKTFGEIFILDLQNAETKGLMFSVLVEAVSSYYPKYNLLIQVKKVSDFNSVATYQGKLARIKIEYNAKAAKEIHSSLVGLKNFGEDDYKHKERLIRKLNLLLNNNPTIDEVIYITISIYIAKGHGSAEKFKKELAEHLK